MSRIHGNNFSTTLNGDIDNSQTSIILTSVSGFPSIGAGITCNITVQQASNIEIMTATTRSSNTLTVTRGAESTTPQSFTSGATVEIRITAASIDNKQDAISGASLTSVTLANDDKVLIQDTSDSNNLKTVTAQSIADLSSMQFITSKTASNSATLDFTDLPTAKAIVFIINDLVPATDDTVLYIRTSVDTGGSPTFDTGGSDYGYGIHGLSTATHTASASATDTQINTHGGTAGLKIGNASGEGVNATIYLYNPLGSGGKHFRGELAYTNADGIPAVWDFTGKRNSTSAVNAVRFLMSSGNITSGVIYAYKIV